MLDPHRLRVLREVAAHGSMVGAARALSYTQPAVSHHIARLESEVGTPLVIRHGRGVRLTEAGRALVAHADAVLARLAAAEEEVATIAGLRAGRVRLAAFPTAAAAFLPEALLALRRRAPGLSVTVAVDAEPPEALAALRRDEVDVAVVFAYPEAVAATGDDGLGAGFETVTLFEEPLSVVAPAGHRLAGTAEAAGGGEVRLADLADEPWIAGCDRCRAHLLDAFGRIAVRPRLAYITDDHLAVQRLVACGLAVAALPALAFALHHEPGVVRLGAPELGTRTVSAVVATQPRPPATDAVLEELLDATATLRAPTTGRPPGRPGGRRGPVSTMPGRRCRERR